MTKLQLNLARTYEERGYDAVLKFWTEKQNEIKSLSEKERADLKNMILRYSKINGDKNNAAFIFDEKASLQSGSGFDFFFEFGQIYQCSKSVEKDAQKAADCFRKSAMCGNRLAAYMLGEMYMTDSGIGKNKGEAEKWYIVASGDRASYLSKMTIPDGITSVGSFAFEGVDELVSVEIPESVQIIGNSAFANCRNLRSVDFKNQKVSVSYDAFSSCDSLDDESKALVKKLSASTKMIFVEGGILNGNTIRSFEIGKYLVTQELYESVIGNNPSYHKGKFLPVETVSWFDAIEFCNVLSKKDGLMPYYTGTKGTSIECDFSANGYRLPTNDEWEFAARGGNKSKGYKYSGSDNIDEVAWYSKTSGKETHEVGMKKPNELGIYDMSGNVCEWVWDKPDSPYTRFRYGGCYNYDAGDCEVGACKTRGADYRGGILGFRLACNAY
ncbi:MAG: SUMF1/EgtB/PvdO family nonheme iron enzyme [Treponema sp.]|nr:SUMF1/EgtB/PvdO family nonheme iron enzyme [Treponema sp.]